MIKTVFLLAVFSSYGFNTNTDLTPMPDMDTCKKAEKVLYEVQRKGKIGWNVDDELPIKKPIKTKCIEL